MNIEWSDNHLSISYPFYTLIYTYVTLQTKKKRKKKEINEKYLTIKRKAKIEPIRFG